eukprot:16388-Heterococcus_DN1.PRE.2
MAAGNKSTAAALMLLLPSQQLLHKRSCNVLRVIVYQVCSERKYRTNSRSLYATQASEDACAAC